MKNLLGIVLPSDSKIDILDKIKKYILMPTDFFHIVSLNPENAVLAQKSKLFKEVVNKAQIKIVDGVGIVLAAHILSLKLSARLTGVDLMEELIKIVSHQRLTVGLIGGRPNLAEKLADCYNEQFSEANFFGVEGIKDISKPQKEEEERIFSIITNRKPRMIFVSFGSPYQELWLWKNRARLRGIVVMGVGGAFEYLSGSMRRPPLFIRKLGLEWLYRLIRQPWRLKRQLRLVEFMWLVAKQKIKDEPRYG